MAPSLEAGRSQKSLFVLEKESEMVLGHDHFIVPDCVTDVLSMVFPILNS